MKSGPSYLDEHTEERSSIAARAAIWTISNHSLPVLLILVDGEKEIACWTEIDDSVVVAGDG